MRKLEWLTLAKNTITGVPHAPCMAVIHRLGLPGKSVSQVVAVRRKRLYICHSRRAAGGTSCDQLGDSPTLARMRCRHATGHMAAADGSADAAPVGESADGDAAGELAVRHAQPHHTQDGLQPAAVRVVALGQKKCARTSSFLPCPHVGCLLRILSRVASSGLLPATLGPGVLSLSMRAPLMDDGTLLYVSDRRCPGKSSLGIAL